MPIERQDIIARLRTSYAVLSDEGRFPLALTAHAANCEIQSLRDGIREIITICEQDARDQDHNATQTGFGCYAKAYAEGRGTARKGIATRLRALLPETP